MTFKTDNGTTVDVGDKQTVVRWSDGSFSEKKNYVWPLVSREHLAKEGISSRDVDTVLYVIEKLVTAPRRK